MNMLRSVRFPLRERGGLLALALPLLAGTGRGQGEAAAESLAQYLPADAVALLSLPDLTATLEDCRSLPLWKIGREKAVSDFLEPPLKQLRTWIEAERKKALGTAGFDPGTALEIKFRAIEVGLARLRMPEQGGPPEVAVAVRVDAGADFPTMKALLDGLKAKIPPGEGEVREETSGGKTFTVVGPPAGAKAPSAAVFWTGEGTAVYLAVGTPGSRRARLRSPPIPSSARARGAWGTPAAKSASSCACRPRSTSGSRRSRWFRPRGFLPSSVPRA